MHAGAHESDAHLRDDALLLSRHARIETTPELEIKANDVRAFHAATVGSLDADTLFSCKAAAFRDSTRRG